MYPSIQGYINHMEGIVTGSRKTYNELFKAQTIMKWKDSCCSMAELERELGITKGLLRTWVDNPQLQATTASFMKHSLFPWTGAYIRRKSAHLWYITARNKQMEHELTRLNREIDHLNREKDQADCETAQLDRETVQMDREIAFHKEVDQIMEIVAAAVSGVGKWPTDKSRISMGWQAAPMRSD